MSDPMAPNPVTTGSQAFGDLTNQLLQRLMKPQSALPGSPSGQQPQAAQPQKDDQIIPGRGKNAFNQELGQKVANDIMGGVQKAVQEHKQKQINEATAMWMSLQAAHQRLVDTNQVGPNGEVDLMNDPIAKGILSDPKKMKNMAKAFNVDFMNPEKTNVYAEGLKKAMKLDKAGKMMKVMRALKMAKGPQVQADPQAMGQEIGKKIEGMVSRPQADPKALEGMARIIEARAQHEDNMEYKRQAHEDSMQLRRMSLDQQKMALEQRAQDRQQTREMMAQNHKEMMDWRWADLQWKKEHAESSEDVAGLKDAVARGYPIQMITPKLRDKVALAFEAEGKMVPKPFSPVEQQALDGGSEQEAKLDFWSKTLEQLAGPDGQLPNKPFAQFVDRLKYAAHIATPASAILSDMSREKWAALAGLVKGVRRGDILRDMTQHTPDPWGDSIRLMYIKIEALKANFKIAKATAMKEHGLEYDPATGEDVDTMIASYADHLKAYDTQIKQEKLAPFEKFKVKK